MHYNALFAFDLRAAKLKNDCDIAEFSIVISPGEGVSFKSNVKTVGVDVPQVLLEINYQLLHPDVAVCLEVLLLEYYELDEERVQDTRFYVPQQQFLQISSAQTLCFRSGKHEIFAEAQVEQLELENVIRFPIIELALHPMMLPLSRIDMRSLISVEIESPSHACVFEPNSSILASGTVSFPLLKEFLIKICLSFTVCGNRHTLTLFTMRVAPKPEMKKGIFFAVNDIELKLKPSLFRVIDCIVVGLRQQQEFFFSEETGKVFFKEFVCPGFLEQLAEHYEMRLSDFNYPLFQQAKLVSGNANKKLQKMLDAQLNAMTKLQSSEQLYEGLEIVGTTLVYTETSNILLERPPSAAFEDVRAKAQGAAYVTLLDYSPEFGYVVLSTKDFQNLDIIEENELGSGNLAVINTVDNKKYQLTISKANTSQTLKLFESTQKSLADSLKGDLTLHTLVYEIGRGLIKRKLTISKLMIIDALQTKGWIELQIAEAVRLVMFVHDQKYSTASAFDQDLNQAMIERFHAERSIKPASEFDTQQVLLQFHDSYTTNTAATFNSTAQTFLQIVEAEREQKIEEERRRQDEELERRLELQKREEEEELQERLRMEQEQRENELRKREEEERRDLSRQRRRDEAQRLGITEEGEFDHRLFQEQKDEEDRKRREEEKAAEEQKRREEELRKLELKKLRNLKFQPQRQQFIVNRRGDTHTFYYNTGEGESQSNNGKKYDMLPKVEIRHQITSPDTIISNIKYIYRSGPPIKRSKIRPESTPLVEQSDEPSPAEILAELPSKSHSQGKNCMRRLSRSPLRYRH